MGEGEGGGGQDKDLLGPPSPSSPPTEGGESFGRISLINYGLHIKKISIVDSLVLSLPLSSISFENPIDVLFYSLLKIESTFVERGGSDKFIKC